MSSLRLVGILGGTFDPIHFGHLRIAEEVADALDLCEVRFIPAGTPNLRSAPVASAAHRAAMVTRAIQGNPRFVLDERELKRPGISYTVDTLLELRQKLEASAAFCLVIGSDAFARIESWYRWRELFDLAHIAVVERPGYPAGRGLTSALKAQWEARSTSSPQDLESARAGHVISVPTTFLEISASAIRSRIEAGKSVRYLLPDSVLDYIQAHRLYISGGR